MLINLVVLFLLQHRNGLKIKVKEIHLTLIAVGQVFGFGDILWEIIWRSFNIFLTLSKLNKPTDAVLNLRTQLKAYLISL